MRTERERRDLYYGTFGVGGSWADALKPVAFASGCVDHGRKWQDICMRLVALGTYHYFFLTPTIVINMHSEWKSISCIPSLRNCLYRAHYESNGHLIHGCGSLL